jgi:DNA-binding transcriptional MocR family regulator
MEQSAWTPSIASGAAPLWQRLVAAVEADLASGRLQPGQRLPPHRELAYRLGVGVGTVSKAYAEAERSGLLASHVGRGTFVAERSAIPRLHGAKPGPIDMAHNLPPIAPSLARLEATLRALHKRADVAALVDYSPTAGLESVREAGAFWLREQCRLPRARADAIIQTNGGQHGLLLACASVAQAGDTILCDAATYPGNRTIAELGRWRLHGVAADTRGMDPAALDRAATESGARAVIVMPTLHNPTTVTLDAARRRELLDVAHARDLIVIEDDVYRVFGRADDPPPLAELAPERVIQVASVSKALAPGLRLGFLVPPDDGQLFERLLLGAQASVYCPQAMGGLIFAQWVEDGLAPRILDEVREEAARRNRLARETLGSAMAEPHSPQSLHVWLPMSAERAHRVAARALQANVQVTPPEAPFVEASNISGLRLCLGAAIDGEALATALQVVKTALADGAAIASRGIV